MVMMIYIRFNTSTTFVNKLRDELKIIGFSSGEVLLITTWHVKKHVGGRGRSKYNGASELRSGVGARGGPTLTQNVHNLRVGTTRTRGHSWRLCSLVLVESEL